MGKLGLDIFCHSFEPPEQFWCYSVLTSVKPYGEVVQRTYFFVSMSKKMAPFGF